MASIKIDGTLHKFTVSNKNNRLTILSEPVSTPGIYEKYEKLEITLNRSITEIKAWEITYLLNNYAENFKINNPENESYISD